MNCNLDIILSKVESTEVVRLSNEEKREYTSTRFLFSKYIKIDLKDGRAQYLYVSHYSVFRIKEIIRLLTTEEIDEKIDLKGYFKKN